MRRLKLPKETNCIRLKLFQNDGWSKKVSLGWRNAGGCGEFAYDGTLFCEVVVEKILNSF